MSLRAVIALSITYGAYSAEIFRAGIQSVPVGQMEAARSQGLELRTGHAPRDPSAGCPQCSAGDR